MIQEYETKPEIVKAIQINSLDIVQDLFNLLPKGYTFTYTINGSVGDLNINVVILDKSGVKTNAPKNSFVVVTKIDTIMIMSETEFKQRYVVKEEM